MERNSHSFSSLRSQVRTLRLLILPDQEMANTPLASSKRSYFLLSVAVLQLVMSYFLGVCK